MGIEQYLSDLPRLVSDNYHWIMYAMVAGIVVRAALAVLSDFGRAKRIASYKRKK